MSSEHPTFVNEFGDLNDYLAKSTKEANDMPFHEKAEFLSRVVAKEASLRFRQAIKESFLLKDFRWEEFQKLATQATEKSAELFEPMYDPLGQVKTKDELSALEKTDYKKARSEASKVAYDALIEGSQQIEPGISKERVDHLITDLDFLTIRDMTARRLGLSGSYGTDSNSITNAIRKDLKSTDHFWNVAEELPLENKIGALRDPREEYLIEMGSRLANATWKVGQPFRRDFEIGTNGTSERASQETQENYAPFDEMQKNMFARLIKEGYTEEEALNRVAFEVWKDVIELKKHAEPPETPSHHIVDGTHPAYPKRNLKDPVEFTKKGEHTEPEPDPRPVNPMGETGLTGRGWDRVWKWGEQKVSDKIMFRKSSQGVLEVLVIERTDAPSGTVAPTGGYRDVRKGALEGGVDAAERKGREEAGISGGEHLGTVYKGRIPEKRATDNVWYYDEAEAFLITDGQEPSVTDPTEIRDSMWMPATLETCAKMEWHHGALVAKAIEQYGKRILTDY